MITISQVEATDTKWIDAKAGVVRQRAAETRDSLIMQKQQDMARGIIGSAGEEAQSRNDEIVAKLERLSAALGRLGEALAQANSRLTNSRSQVLECVTKLEGQGWGVADDGTASLVPGSPSPGTRGSARRTTCMSVSWQRSTP